jgi:ribosomal protein L32
VPSARERTLIRRRLRALRRRREALMREVGGLVLDSKHEQNGAPESLDERTRELDAVDSEARSLVHALEERKTLDELMASGVSSRCENCGELVARREHYCTNCGAQQDHSGAAPTGPPRSAQPAATTAVVTGASSGQAPTPPAH